MLQKGHFGLSLVLAAPIAGGIALLTTPLNAVLLLAGAIIGSGLPDLDTQTSIVKHRGFTHTVWFTGMITILGTVFFTAFMQLFPFTGFIIEAFELPGTFMYTAPVVFGVATGYGVITHLLGDAITPRGIKPFHPVTPRNRGGVTVNESKYVYDVANASNKTLNEGMFAAGVVVTCGTLYLVVQPT